MLKRRKNFSKRVGAKAAVYMSSVLEYLTAEILEIAGNCARDFASRSITPRHLQLAIRNDNELDSFFQGTISGGGVCPRPIQSQAETVVKEEEIVKEEIVKEEIIKEEEP